MKLYNSTYSDTPDPIIKKSFDQNSSKIKHYSEITKGVEEYSLLHSIEIASITEITIFPSYITIT